MILTFSEEVDFFGRDDGDQAHGEHNEFHHDDDWGGIFVPSLERERIGRSDATRWKSSWKVTSFTAKTRLFLYGISSRGRQLADSSSNSLCITASLFSFSLPCWLCLALLV